MADSNANLAGKVVLVTGATGGIGAVTARELAAMGARVVVVGRDRERCAAAVGRIAERGGPGSAEALVADLSSQQEVRRLAGEFLERFDRLDVLVNNAGGLFAERRTSADGIEMTFALNHLAYFLLTNLLLDRLRASAPSRIVNVASEAHRMAGALVPDELANPRRYQPLRAYGRSKLANLLFTAELARRLEGSGVTCNALHPGFVATNIFAGRGLAPLAMQVGARLFAISPEEGAKTSIFLASSPEVEGVSGTYFYRSKPIEPAKAGLDAGAARRLWELSAGLVGAG